MGFQGRPGPPGPHGIGEPGLPVSTEAEILKYSASTTVYLSAHTEFTPIELII